MSMADAPGWLIAVTVVGIAAAWFALTEIVGRALARERFNDWRSTWNAPGVRMPREKKVPADAVLQFAILSGRPGIGAHTILEAAGYTRPPQHLVELVAAILENAHELRKARGVHHGTGRG
jgi:hypothetical protein